MSILQHYYVVYIVRHKIGRKPFRFCTSFSYMYALLRPFPTTRGLNVCQSENVRIRADVKPLVPLALRAFFPDSVSV